MWKNPKRRAISREEGLSFARKHRCLFIETSAETNDGVQLAFEQLIEKILHVDNSWEDTPDMSVSNDSLSCSTQSPAPSSSGCPKRKRVMTEEQRAANRITSAKCKAKLKALRAKETPEEREARLTVERERRAAATAEELEAKTVARRKYYAAKYARETPEQREKRLSRKREINAKFEAKLTPEQKKAINEASRLRARAKFAAMTPEERQAHSQRLAEKRKSWTPEQREARRRSRRKSKQKRAANETPQEREARLAAYAARRAAETLEEREARLQHSRKWCAERLAKETPEQRKKRLEYKRQFNVKEQIAAREKNQGRTPKFPETEQERLTRLANVRLCASILREGRRQQCVPTPVSALTLPSQTTKPGTTSSQSDERI